MMFNPSRRYTAARPMTIVLGILCATVLTFHPAVLPPAFSADKSSVPMDKKLAQSDSPVHIASDRMDVDQTTRSITFQGHVVVQQDELTITGKTLKVFAASDDNKDRKEKKKEDAGMMDRIDRIEVEGDVKISQRDKVAVADRAVYYHQEQKIVLMGNPSVSQGQDTVQGRLITLYIAQGRSVVEGGTSGPVKAVLHPSRKE